MEVCRAFLADWRLCWRLRRTKRLEHFDFTAAMHPRLVGQGEVCLSPSAVVEHVTCAVYHLGRHGHACLHLKPTICSIMLLASKGMAISTSVNPNMCQSEQLALPLLDSSLVIPTLPIYSNWD